MRPNQSLLRSLIALSALSLLGPAAGCGGDDSGAGDTGNGKPDAATRSDASTDRSTLDVSTAPITCSGSTDPCPGLSIAGMPALPACCTSTGMKCGNDISAITSLTSMLPAGTLGDAAAPMLDPSMTCVEKNQPGVADPTCPSAALGPINVVGCCTPGGVCGALLNDFTVATFAISLGFGCVDPTKFGMAAGDAAPQSCTYHEGGTPDAAEDGDATTTTDAPADGSTEAATEAGAEADTDSASDAASTDENKPDGT